MSAGSSRVKYRKLRSSDLLISERGFGSWLTFTDPQRKQLTISSVHRALDLGIKFLDTANVYGRGAAEMVSWPGACRHQARARALPQLPAQTARDKLSVHLGAHAIADLPLTMVVQVASLLTCRRTLAMCRVAGCYR